MHHHHHFVFSLNSFHFQTLTADRRQSLPAILECGVENDVTSGGVGGVIGGIGSGVPLPYGAGGEVTPALNSASLAALQQVTASASQSGSLDLLDFGSLMSLNLDIDINDLWNTLMKTGNHLTGFVLKA